MPQVKVVFEAQKEIRRFLLPAVGAFQDLTNKIRSVLGDNVNFRLVWKDTDGDFVVCESESELQTALDLVNAATGNQSEVLRLYVRVTGQTTPRPSAPPSTASGESIFDQVTLEDDAEIAQEQSKPVLPPIQSQAKPSEEKKEELPKKEEQTGPKNHVGVACDGCGGSVIGTRFKCTKCRDYDLCETCKTRGFHLEHELETIGEPRPRPDVSSNPWLKMMFGGDAAQRDGGQPGLAPFPGMHQFMRQACQGGMFNQQQSSGCPMNGGASTSNGTGAGCPAEGPCRGPASDLLGNMPKSADEIAGFLQAMGFPVDVAVVRDLLEQFQGDIRKIIEAMS